MFTIDQIKYAHSKVKSGADFPNYIQELKALGVKSYDNYVTDGTTQYYGPNSYATKASSKYAPLKISDTSSKEELNNALKVHQGGGSDYPTFCKQAAECGVEKWTVDIDRMTCVYYDKAGRAMITETIPG